MPLSFSISGTSDQQYVFTGGGNLSQLIKSQALTLGGEDSLSGFIGEFKGADSESLRDVEEPVVVGDGANNSEDSGVELGLSFGYFGVVLRENLGNSGDGDGISVEPGLVESFMDGGIEVGGGSSGEEGIQLDEGFNIGVGGFGFSDTSVGDSAASD